MESVEYRSQAAWLIANEAMGRWCGPPRAGAHIAPPRPGRIYSYRRARRPARPRPRHGDLTAPASAAPASPGHANTTASCARLNQARRRDNQARKAEIDAREFRNHMRDMLFAFKGTPSTSPFCPWINDPYESEELPCDWTPPEPEPVPDDAPF